MAPPSTLGKRVKGTQITRPFIYGSTARPFGPNNPKPDGIPDDHTHSWEVFVKGIDDTDIAYWCRRVQFKLHESIPNHVRMIEGQPGKPFLVKETGWGEFEIAIKLYYATESGEKPQTVYHHLRLHPYGRTEEEKEEMRGGTGEVRSWVYEEQVFNEPFESFYQVLTSGARPKSHPAAKGGKGGKGKNKPIPPLPSKPVNEVWERTAMLPAQSRPDLQFSHELQDLEIQKLKQAQDQAQRMCKKMLDGLKEKEAMLAKLKAENAAAASNS